MALHTDLPTRAQIGRLMTHRMSSSVSLYLPTGRLPDEGRAAQIELKNLAAEALDQLRASGEDKRVVGGIETLLGDLAADDEFWSFQAVSLAVFVSPTGLRTFRLPNRLLAAVEVSDRFHIKPLLRSCTFPHEGFVLALAAGSVRLLEFGPDGPSDEVDVPDLPADAWDPRGNKVVMAREATYVRRIDQALRPILNGQDLPLVLAATETIAALYRTVNSYPGLADGRNAGNPETTSDADLVAAARLVLDDVYAEQLASVRGLFDQRSSQGRSATDVSDVARLATFGAVDTVLVDIDQTIPGSVDEGSGAVTFDPANDASNYGVLDEVARRVFLSGGSVLAVRQEDIPGGGPVAAILRYAI